MIRQSVSTIFNNVWIATKRWIALIFLKSSLKSRSWKSGSPLRPMPINEVVIKRNTDSTKYERKVIKSRERVWNWPDSSACSVAHYKQTFMLTRSCLSVCFTYSLFVINGSHARSLSSPRWKRTRKLNKCVNFKRYHSKHVDEKGGGAWGQQKTQYFRIRRWMKNMSYSQMRLQRPPKLKEAKGTRWGVGQRGVVNIDARVHRIWYM